MSTIVVVKKKNRVVIGADSLQLQGSLKVRNIYQTPWEKIFKYRESYIGTVGSTAFDYVLPSLFKKHKDLIKLDSPEEIFETLVRIHPILKDEYFIETNEHGDEEQEFESNQIFGLIANRTGAYQILSYREVHRIERFWAIGS